MNSWYCEPQNIFSAALVLATFALVITNIMFWRKQGKMLFKQEQLMKLNIITNISHGLYLQTTFGKSLIETYMIPMSRAIPGLEEDLRSWYKDVPHFEESKFDKYKSS